MSRNARTILVYLTVGFLVLMGVNLFLDSGNAPTEMSLDSFLALVEDGDVAEATIMEKSEQVVAVLVEGATVPGGGSEVVVGYPNEYEDQLTEQLLAAGVDVTSDPENPSMFQWFLGTIFPYLLIFGVFIFILMQMQGGGNRVMQFGKARTKQVTKETPKVTFDDVAGADEAVEELVEIKEFLANPAKFRAMGAKIPKGVLLYGPPGTGKTLLARAVAGEAGVPFFPISGSDFVEMFVGVGASRVRDLFEQAKAQAPAIVFIDEIDAVGRHRGAGLGGGHDEREQTLNQLLVELDGFDVKVGIIVIAATNRPDILDPALLRPGRFDRQIVVDRPDLKGREKILTVHAKGKPLADGVDLSGLARQTPGFTGADLANLINEAALLAARRGKAEIGISELEEAIDRVMAGPERRSRVISEAERELTAYHEGGHALVGHVLPNLDPIHKVTIIPRGRAGGYTLALPMEEKYFNRRSELVDQLAYALGGRTAEELVFDDPSTGANNDIEKATNLARKMVMEYGMSDKLGPLQYGKPEGEVFLGRDYSQRNDISNEVAAAIDDEVRQLITQAHDEAREIITTHRDALDRIAKALLENETLDAKQVAEVLGDVPKWEHVGNGGFRIQAPSQQAAGDTVEGMVAAQAPDGSPGPISTDLRPPVAFTPATWRIRSRTLTTADHTLVMGVLNVTADSFSDGARFEGADAAVAAGLALWEQGADLVDVGGESTRPGSTGVSPAEELDRVVPVVAALAAAGVTVSVDTSKPEVAATCLDAGAEVVNDVTALVRPEMAEVCADRGSGVVLMHMQGTPETMQRDPSYQDVVTEVERFLLDRAGAAVAAGIEPARICLDPGLGFGKRFADNLDLLAGLGRLASNGFPLLVGTSRKGFLGEVLDAAGHPASPARRDPATHATTALAVAAGVAVVRVHDVVGGLQAARTADAIVRCHGG